MENQYKVSIVTAVYNVEEYLEEMVESIVAQTIGFENVQLILVDDGSADNSGNICDLYAEKYPDNIIVIHKENGGVSSARNEGLKHIKGEYVNFTDSDDMLQENALELMYDYLKENEKWIDLVAIRLKFFGASGGRHPLNYKFNKTRIVDLRKEYNCIQLQSGSTLIKRECFDNRYFDLELSYAEDAQLLMDILLDKMRYGIISETNYLYRKREGEDSAIDTGRQKKSYYIPYMEKFILYSLENAMKKRKYIPKFVQYTCMYDLQWRLKKTPLVEPGVLSEKEIELYKTLILSAIQYFDDKIIQEQKNIDSNYKSAILLLKKENKEKKELVFLPNDLVFYLKDTPTVTAGSYGKSFFEFIEITPEEIIIEGFVKCYPELSNIEIILKNNQEADFSIEYKSETFDRDEKCSFCMDEKIIEARGFRFIIKRNELPEEMELHLYQRYQDHNIECKSVWFGKFFPLSKELKNSYFYEDGILMTHEGGIIKLSSTTKKGLIKKCEKALQKEILSKRNKKAFRGWIARKIYHIFKNFKKKEIWLISDRFAKADDNGEALFSYINSTCDRSNISTYFVLDKNSIDYQRLKNIGKIVPFHSTKHKIVSLLCDKIVSSQADEFVINRFFDQAYLYKDIMYKQKFVFLQHGVTKDDQSRWLAKPNKNISIFVTTTYMEYQSILDYSYYYDARQVKCTGFPRYDYLYDNSTEKNIITFMPTWRLYLVGGFDVRSNERKLKSGFQNSSYCHMYQQVFSSSRLLEAVKKYNYHIKLMLHPAMPEECIAFFDCDNSIEILDKSTRYRELYADSKLIITDYSSAVFDFAYLRKPVLYYQQDADEFFAGKHVYDKGYFDYEQDGFGEVEYSAEALIDRIIEYMKNGCKLKDVYRERIEKTFPYNDKNNCKRVYEAIINS